MSIYPEIIMSSTYSNINEIAKEENEHLWDFTRKRLDGWKHHINRINHPRHKIPDEIFAQIIDIMKNNSIKMFIETKSAYTGSETSFEKAGFWDADRDISYIKRIYKHGYECHGLELDGAFFDYTNAGMSDEQAGQAVVDYFKSVHEAYPEILLYLLFNFPNWGWKGEGAYRTDNGNPMYMGDAYDTYNFLSDLLKRNNIPIEGVVIDNPYDYTVAEHELIEKEVAVKNVKEIDWIARILEFESIVHKQNLKFYMIFNSQNGGDTDNQRYHDETIAYIDLYYKSGGRPDGAEMESWYKKPDEFLPETSELTMTGITKDSILLIDKLLRR